MKEIRFYILIDTRIGKTGKITFELYKTDRFQKSGKVIPIKCILPIPEEIFKEPKYVAQLSMGQNKVASGVIKDLEEELDRLKANEKRIGGKI